MKDELIKFETAKLAKEKGFDVPCNHYIYTSKALKIVNKNREGLTGDKNTFKENHTFSQKDRLHKGRMVSRNSHLTTISTPTQSLLQKWLREEHDIHVEIELIDNSRTFQWEYAIVTSRNRDYNDLDCMDSAKRHYNSCNFKTYELALEFGLFNALKLLP
jgi:hypothetical protein